MERYLKAIYEIAEGGGRPRVKTIAERLGVKMPSVSGALGTLRRDGLVAHHPYGEIHLTPRGRKLARAVVARNDVLQRFLNGVLGASPPAASRDACVLEHALSASTFERLSLFLEYLDETGPHAPGFRRWLENAHTPEESHNHEGDRHAS